MLAGDIEDSDRILLLFKIYQLFDIFRLDIQMKVFWSKIILVNSMKLMKIRAVREKVDRFFLKLVRVPSWDFPRQQVRRKP